MAIVLSMILMIKNLPRWLCKTKAFIFNGYIFPIMHWRFLLMKHGCGTGDMVTITLILLDSSSRKIWLKTCQLFNNVKKFVNHVNLASNKVNLFYLDKLRKLSKSLSLFTLMFVAPWEQNLLVKIDILYDFTWITYVYFLRQKLDVFYIFKKFKA